MLTRIAISAIVFIVFALHVAASPRFEVIDRMENYLYDVQVRATMPGGIDERIVIIAITREAEIATPYNSDDMDDRGTVTLSSP